MKTQTIWDGVLDNRYKGQVVRVSERTGRLTVVDTQNGTQLLSTLVPLAYGAQFGPDVADVAAWKELVEAVAANPRTSSDYLWPPTHWKKVEQAYALAARHYWRVKAAELGHLSIDVETLADVQSELTLISSMLAEEVQGVEVRQWILETGNAWLIEKANEAGIKVAFCEGECKRVTAQSKGRFVCITCAHQAEKKGTAADNG